MTDAKPVLADPLGLAPSNPFMDAEEKEVLEKKQAALDKLLEEHNIAKYKIEILFAKDFSPNKPSAGIMSFWESGNKLHGGGDTIMHMCPGKDLGKNNCTAFIPDVGHGYGFLVCPTCKEAWEGEQVSGQIAFRLVAQDWAKVVLRYFQKLEMRADIYMKYHPHDIRTAAAREQANMHMGEVLQGARMSRKPRIYPLANIIKDTSAGADLEARFLAFLRA
jgi:hypothetical protein